MKSSLSRALAAASLGFAAVEAFQYPDCVKGPLANTTVCDPKASPPDRAAALVKAMNITEKLANLVEYAQINSNCPCPRHQADSRRVVRARVLQGLAYLRMRGGVKRCMA